MLGRVPSHWRPTGPASPSANQRIAPNIQASILGGRRIALSRPQAGPALRRPVAVQPRLSSTNSLFITSHILQQRRSIFSLFKRKTPPTPLSTKETTPSTDSESDSNKSALQIANDTLDKIMHQLQMQNFDAALKTALELYDATAHPLPQALSGFALDAALYCLVSSKTEHPEIWDRVIKVIDSTRHDSAVVKKTFAQALADQGHHLSALAHYHQACKPGFKTYFERIYKSEWIDRMFQFHATLPAMTMLLSCYFNGMTQLTLIGTVGKFLPALLSTEVTFKYTTLSNPRDLLLNTIEAYPNNPTLRVMQTALLLKEGKIDQCIQEASDMFRKFNNPLFCKTLAAAYFVRGDLTSAFQNFIHFASSGPIQLRNVVPYVKLAYMVANATQPKEVRGALQSALSFPITADSMSRPVQINVQISLLEILTLQTAICYKYGEAKEKKVPKGLADQNNTEVKNPDQLDSQVKQTFVRARHARNLITLWKDFGLLTLKHPAVNQAYEKALKYAVLFELVTIAKVDREGSPTVSKQLADLKSKYSSLLTSEFPGMNEFSTVDIDPILKLEQSELIRYATDEISEYSELEFEDLCIQQALVADRYLLWEETEFYLQFCDEHYGRSPYWYNTAIKITTGLPRYGENAVRSDYNPVNLATDFVDDYPELKVAWAMKARVTLQELKLNKDAVTEKDLAVVLMAAKRAILSQPLVYAEDLKDKELFDMAVEALVELWKITGKDADVQAMVQSLHGFLRELGDMTIQMNFATAFSVWTEDQMVPAETRAALLQVTQDLLDRVPGKLANLDGAKLLIARVKALTKAEDAQSFLESIKASTAVNTMLMADVYIILGEEQKAIETFKKYGWTPQALTFKEDALVQLLFMLTASIALFGTQASRVLFESRLKSSIPKQKEEARRLIRFWLALTTEPSPTMEKEIAPVASQDFGGPTDDDLVPLAWRHKAVGFYESYLRIIETFPPTLRRKTIQKLVELNRSVAMEGSGKAMIGDLEAGRILWDHERLDRCLMWHSQAMSAVVKEMLERKENQAKQELKKKASIRSVASQKQSAKATQRFKQAKLSKQMADAAAKSLQQTQDQLAKSSTATGSE